MEDNDDVPLNAHQAEALRRLLPPGTPIGDQTRFEAACLIRLHNPYALWRDRPPSNLQEAFLKRFARWRTGLNRGQASDLIEEIMAVAKKYPGGFDYLEIDSKNAFGDQKHPIDRWKEAAERLRQAEQSNREDSVVSTQRSGGS